MQPTKLPEPGDIRIWKNFDFKMSLQNDASIDILFTKNKETQALHMNCKKGSYLEFTIPWLIDEHGFQTKISSLLIALDASTSLSYRSLLECETLQVRLIEIVLHFSLMRLINNPRQLPLSFEF